MEGIFALDPPPLQEYLFQGVLEIPPTTPGISVFFFSWTKESIYRTEIWYFLFCVRDPVKNMISPKRHCNVLFGSSERSVNHSGHLTLFPNSDLQPATCNLRPANYTLRISFIIYSALSTPFYFFAVRFVVDLKGSQTHFSFWKWATAAIQDHIFISFLIDAVAGDVNTCL